MSTSTNQSKGNSYEINFTMECTNTGPLAKIVTVGSSPNTDTDSQKTIKEIYDDVLKNGINIGNSTEIEQELTELTNKIKLEYPDNDQIEEDVNSVMANSKNKNGLLWSLKELYNSISDENLDVTLPDQDIKISPKPTGVYYNINAPVKSTNTIIVPTRQSIATVVTKLDANLSTANKNLSSLVDRLKSSIKSTTTSESTSLLSGQIGTNGRSRDNIINRIAATLLGRNGVKFSDTINRLRNSTGTFTTLQNFNLSQISTSLIPPTTMARGYMYEIQSESTNDDTMKVTFKYYPTNEPKYYEFQFYLNNTSFFSLSERAFSNCKNLSDSDKIDLVKSAGITQNTSTTVPSNDYLWHAYLIWVYSYLSFGLQSQMLKNNGFSYPNNSEYDSLNYMLRYGYLETIGNFCTQIQVSYARDVQYAQLLSVSIPRKWVNCMYPNGPESVEQTYKLSESQSIISLINSHLKITASNV